MAFNKVIARYVVAAVVIVTVVTSLVLMFRTSAQHDRDTLGPTRIAAAGDGGWWAISHHHLHRFDRAGQRTWKTSLGNLGITNPATGLGVLSDGRVLLSEPREPHVLLCDLPARTCTRLSLQRRGEKVELRRVALLQGVGDNRFVISDDFGRRLMLADVNGEVLAMRTLHASPADDYEIPFQPRLSADGELLLPNRKTQQIERLNVDTLEPVEKPLVSAGAAMKVPVDAARGADGRWWVINTSPCICSGQIMQFDAQGTRIGRAPVTGFNDPRALAMVDGKLVIADQDGARLGVYDIETGSVSRATGALFLAELAGVVALRAQGNVPGNYLLGAVILMPLFGIGLLVLLGEKLPDTVNPMQPPPAGQAPAALNAEGITWIAITPEYERMLRRARYLSVVLAVMPILMWVYLLVKFQPSLPDPGKLSEIQVILGLVIVTLLPITAIYVLYKSFRRSPLAPRLGIDATHVHRESLAAKRTSAPLGEVMTDGTMLLIGSASLRLIGDRNDHYDREAVSSLILARLPPSAYKSRARLAWITFRRQPYQWLAVLALILVVLVNELVFD
jgi:hypothetical protein